MFGTRGFRYGYAGPAIGSHSNSSLSSAANYVFRPSYAALGGRYYSTSPEVSSYPHYRSHVSSYGYPSHHFGSRLGSVHTGIHAKPIDYDYDISSSYYPGWGRNSWSAYRIADSAIDRDEDLVHFSKRKDHDLIRGVDIALAASAPQIIRAGSVPPGSFRRHAAVQQIVHAGPARSVSRRSSIGGRLGRAGSVQDVRVYDNLYGPPPKVKVVYESVPSGRDLLTAKEKLVSREVVDLESPSGRSSLKLRLAEAANMLDRQGAMLNKYYNTKEGQEVESEVRRIKNSAAMRACSVAF